MPPTERRAQPGRRARAARAGRPGRTGITFHAEVGPEEATAGTCLVPPAAAHEAGRAAMAAMTGTPPYAGLGPSRPRGQRRMASPVTWAARAQVRVRAVGQTRALGEPDRAAAQQPPRMENRRAYRRSEAR